MGEGAGFDPAAWVRAAAVVGRLAEQRAGLTLGRLDEQQVRRRASRQLGRPITGDDPGLRVLLADLAQAPLTPFGAALATQRACRLTGDRSENVTSTPSEGRAVTV